MPALMHKGKNYSGGGTSVTANPTGTATADLTKVGIGSTIYNVKDANAAHLVDGKVPASELPAYVDDVLEYASLANFPAEGESGKIYIALDTNLTYRWGGSAYVEISQSLALGTTHQTAAYGDDAVSTAEPTYSEASTRANLAGSGEKLSVIFGKIKKWFSDLKAVAFSGSYNDLTDQPPIPTVNDNVITIQLNGTTIESFTLNQSSNETVNIQVTKNDVGLGNVDNTSDANKPISTATQSALSGKVDKVNGKGLSTNDYTTAEKEKLAGIEAEAQVNPQGLKTVTGNPLTLTDGSETYAQALSVDLEPIQDLHGQSAPYVGGAGKNKFDAENPSGKYVGGTTVTYNSDTKTLTITGIWYVYWIIKVDQNTDYNFSATLISATVARNYAVYGSDGTSLGDLIMTGSLVDQPSKSFNSGANNYIALLLYGGNSTSGTTVYQYVQVEKGTEKTSYTDYSNICPITGYEQVSVGDVGVNQWDEEWEVGNLNNTTGQTDSTAGYIRSKNFCKCKGSESYCAKAPAADSMRVFWYDGSNNFIESVSIPQNNWVVLTSPSNAAYFKLKTYATTYNNDISINYPATITSYEPYKHRDVSIELGRTVYGGKSNFTDGGTESELAYTTINDLSLTRNPDNGLFYMTLSDAKPPASNNDLAGMFSSCYGEVVYNRISLDDGSIALSTAKMFVIKDTRYTSVTDLKNAMGTQQICYKKATPTTISTPPTDLKLLKNYNYLSTNGTTITLDYIPNNSIGDAVKASEEYTDRQIDRKNKWQKVGEYTDGQTVTISGDYSEILLMPFSYLHVGGEVKGSSVFPFEFFGVNSLFVSDTQDYSFIQTNKVVELSTYVNLLLVYVR